MGILPKDEKFFEMFGQLAKCITDSARLLRRMFAEPDHLVQHVAAIKEIEHQADNLMRTVIEKLDTAFVTPFDREDIHALAEEMDDVADDILAVASLIRLVKPSSIIPELREQAEILVQMADQNADLIDKLESMKDVRGLLDSIDLLESKGDEVHHNVIARLFSGEMEALEVLKWKDIVEAMENALNTLEDISDVVESIVLKHA